MNKNTPDYQENQQSRSEQDLFPKASPGMD
jgi:hypothetical protein